MNREAWLFDSVFNSLHLQFLNSYVTNYSALSDMASISELKTNLTLPSLSDFCLVKCEDYQRGGNNSIPDIATMTALFGCIVPKPTEEALCPCLGGQAL